MLILMFLLPLQVFAGGLSTYIAATPEAHSTQASHQQFLAVADPTAPDDCCLFGDDTIDLSAHADHGDETVPARGFNFTSELASSSPAHSNDSAREPPFLPLIAPPPRA